MSEMATNGEGGTAALAEKNPCWVRMEDDDESGSDILSFGGINMADLYCGQKQIKRYWLINDHGSADMELRIRLECREQGNIHSGELFIDGTGILAHTDEQPSRVQCVRKYEQHRTNSSGQTTAHGEAARTGQQAGQDPVPSDLERPTAAAQSQEQTIPLHSSVIGPSQPSALSTGPLMAPGALQSTQSLLESSTLLPGTAFSVTVTAGQSGKRRTAATSAPPHPAPKSTRAAAAAGGSNLQIDAEFEVAVGWEHIREGNSSARRGGERQGISAANKVMSSSGGSKGAGQRVSTSRLCARQWGQDGVSAELCGYAHVADADKESREAAEMDALGLTDRRFFVGGTARAAKLSKATKSLARLHASKKGASHTPSGITSSEPEPTVPSSVVPSGVQGSENGPDTAAAEDLLQRGSTETANHASDMQRSQENIFRAVLKPQERLQVAVVVCPPVDLIDDSTGARVEGELVVREIGLVAQWRLLLREGDTSALGGVTRGDNPLRIRYRCCRSIIAVTPSEVYELGMCNVGEQRTLTLEVSNKSPLPALVYPYVQSEVLDVSDQDELVVPPLETRQLRISYLAREEQTEYLDRVVLLNAFDDSGHREVRVKARNLDTEQVVLHSMFYKLVTYNSLRQLQVSFERALFNMPNVRVFSVKNVHVQPLRMTFSWNKAAGMRLLVVSAPSEEGTASAPTGVRVTSGGQLLNDSGGGALSSRSGTKQAVLANSGSSNSSSQHQQQEEIEDLKWGDSALEFTPTSHAHTATAPSTAAAAFTKSLTRQTMKRSMSLYSKGGGVSAGDDGAVNYGKGSVTDPKLIGVGISSADIVSVLDLSQASSSFTPSAVAASGSEGGPVEAPTLPCPTPPSKLGTEAVREVRFVDATEDYSAAVNAGQGEPGVVSSAAKSSTGLTSVALQSDLAMKVLEVCGQDSFPFSFVEDATKLADENESRSQAVVADPSADERIKPLKEGGKAVSRSAQDEGGRPHSLGGPLGPGVLPESSAASVPKERERSEAELCVKRIQKAYADLRVALDRGRAADGGCFEELALDVNTNGEGGPSVSSASTTIPLGATVRFAVVYEPLQRAEFEDPEEYTLVRVSESLHIRLPDVDAAEVAACLERSKPSSAQQGAAEDPHLQDEPLAPPAGGLRPRSLPIRASLVRSEMVVIQKNINFGRTVLNDKSSRGVTIVNRSSVPCLFSISKSGSISSGFLQVLGGRKGIIPPFSSKVVEFIFKPSMAGNFEEVLMFNNVLNPRDAQAVTIKAKVHHTETFVLCPTAAPADHSTPMNTVTEKSDSLGMAEANDAARLMQHLTSVSAAQSQSGSAKSISHFLGNCMMMADTTGPQSSHLISFCVRNVTSKARQFIVDATHAHAIELLIAPTSQNSPAGNATEQVQSSDSVLPTSPDKLIATTPFEPIPEVLQSILSLRCRFDSEVVRSGGGQGEGGAPGEGTLSRDERQQLEDSLEQFQQKLKIAIRKNKQEKIEKYQKKIDKVIFALQENKTQSFPAPSAVGGSLKAAPSTSTIATDGDLADSPGVLGTSSTTAPPPSNESEVSYHFQLEPEQERIVHVRLTFLPGPSYRSWSGLLPFHGFLRVFECKNEDHVKVVHFGAMVRTGRLSVTSAVPFSQPEASMCPVDSPSLERRDSITEYRSLAADVPFITTVAQWSSLPTREIYPKYRQLPQNLLPMCVKLVRASTERVMHGSFSVASLLEHAGTLTLSLDEDFSSKASPEYATYNAQRHGEVLFALATTVLSGGVAAQRQPPDLVLGESSSLAAEIGSKPSARSKKDSIVRCLTHQSSSRLKAGSKVDFSVQWRPPVDLSTSSSKQHQPSVAVSGATAGTGEEGHTVVPQALRIVGAIKVQLRIGDKLVGQAQSIPFVGVLEHRSAINVSKHFVCEGACVGSYRSYQLPIQNTSSDQELHYVVSAEEVAGNSKSLGSLEIVSGQTGIIRPGGSKQVSLLFCASSAGRFEQKLWVRNIRDMFDQKRVVVQANIAVAQTKFVVFPDLESSDGVGKYKTVDLGLIQIQSSAGSADPELEPLLPREAEARCFYELRIQNVSGKPLSVTAVSNLKSQCYIYADEDCRQLAIFAPLPTASTTSLFVKIKPSAVGAPDLAADGQESAMPGAEPKKAAVAAGAGSGGRGTRELMGGVKLVFFTSEAAAASPIGANAALVPAQAEDISIPSLAESTPRKLFETAISFKATVGRSVLKMSSGAAPTMCCVSNDCAPSASAMTFAQRFELRNASKVFPLDYAYLLRPGDSCTDSSLTGTNQLAEDSPVMPEVRMTVGDAMQGRLDPGQSKWVTCYVHVPVGAHGVVLCTVRVANLSTLETLSLTLTTFLDPGHMTADSTVTAEEDGGLGDGGEVLAVAARRMYVRNSDTCLWAYRSTAEVAAKVLESSRSAVRFKADSDLSGGLSSATVNLASLAGDALVVQGSAPSELCTWPVRNNRNSAIIVFPASDLPVEVTLVRPSEESIADAAAAVPLLAARSDSDLDTQRNIAAPAVAGREYVSTISPALLRWKPGLVRCGDAFSLEPGAEYKVVVRPKPGAVVKDKHVGTQEGKVVRLQGVVVFLQAAHSLQSLFDPARQREPIASSAPAVSENSRDVGAGPPAAAAQLSVIPVVSVSHIACSLASPLLRLPVKEVALGRRRYNAIAGFQFCVENPSEVDVPVCLDSLPSWMTIEKFALSALAPLPRGDDGSVSLDWAGASGRTSSAKATVAQKLHWWIATNGATISGADNSTTPKRRGSKDSGISYEEWQQALSDAGSTSESGQLASGTGTEKEDDDVLTATNEVESVGGRTRTGSAELSRQHQSDLALSAFDSELLRSRKAAVEHGEGGSLRFFGIPAQSRIYLNIQAKVPVTSAPILRYELRIKNLSSCLVGGGGAVATGPRARYMFDDEGGVVVADEHVLRVSVEVDTTPALEVIPAIDEPLVARSQLSFGGTVKSADVPLHATLVRLLKDPVVVPPPVDVTLDERIEPASGARPLAIQAKSRIPKSHCRFSVKNKLPESVRVKATVEVSAELASILDIKVKFQTSNSDSIDLVHEESSGVKVRVVPRQSGRLRDGGLVASALTLVRLPSQDNNGPGDNRDNDQTPRGRTPTLQGTGADPIAEPQQGAVGAGAASHYRASPALIQLAALGGKRPNEQLVASLLGTVRLTPYTISSSGVVDEPPTEIALDGDVVTVDLVGQLQAGPTSAASANAPSALVPPSLTTSDAAAAPAPTPAPNAVLEFRAVLAPVDCSKRCGGGITDWVPSNSPTLCLAASSVTFYLSNPSTTSELNYSIKAQSYRHAGMSLLLRAEGQDMLNAYDTFMVRASPSRGSIPPSTFITITMTLVPGDPAIAVKAASTLTADIPDPQMRERRLRSHHRDGGAAAGAGTVGASGSASRLVAGLPSGDASSNSSGAAWAETTQIPPTLSNPTTNATPFTVACMPVEVYDVDFPAHPPRILWAYFTSEVPLSVVPTQSLREWSLSRGQGLAPRRGLTRIPSEMGETRFEPIVEGQVSFEAPSAAVPYEREEATPRTPATSWPQKTAAPAASVVAEEVLVPMVSAGSAGVGTSDATLPVVLLNAGTQTQRKESLEWTVTLTNTCRADLPIALVPVFSADTSWLTLSQTGGLLRAGDQLSFMVYAKRAVPVGCYESYIQVADRSSKAASRFLLVSMEILSEAKRAVGVLPPVPSAPRISSSSADNLPALAGPASDDANGRAATPVAVASIPNVSGDSQDLAVDAALINGKVEQERQLGAFVRQQDSSTARVSSNSRLASMGTYAIATDPGAERKPVALKPLFQVRCAREGGPDHTPRTPRSAEVGGDEADGAVGLPLTPIPSPTDGVRKRLALTDGSAHPDGPEESRLVMSIVSCADITLPVQVRCVLAPGAAAGSKLLVAGVADDEICSPSQETDLMLSARQSIGLRVHVNGADRTANCRLFRPDRGPSVEGTWEGTEVRSGESSVGCILVDTPLLPNQQQVIYVVTGRPLHS